METAAKEGIRTEAAMLEVEAEWEHVLSLGEQQRLGFARVLKGVEEVAVASAPQPARPPQPERSTRAAAGAWCLRRAS